MNFGKHGMLRKPTSRALKLKKRKRFEAEIAKRKKWVTDNAELAEFLRKKRVREYLKTLPHKKS